MVTSTLADSQLDCHLLLLAHLICADEQIHLQEDRALQLFAQRNNCSQETQHALNSIFSRHPGAPSMEVITQQIPPNEHADVLEQLVLLGHVDDYYAPVENDFIERVASSWKIDATVVKRLRMKAEQTQYPQVKLLESEKRSQFGDTIKKVELYLAKRCIDIAPDVIGRRVHELKKEILLAGPEYDDAIKGCADVAHNDYQIAARELDSASETLDRFSKNLNDVLRQLETQVCGTRKANNLNDVVIQLEKTRASLQETALEELEKIQTILKAKHRSLNRFSIAFMGKTKAGKSTLHAVITGEGWNSIGVGTQRTTRYNRIYDWKNIRIIDTPGIGAPGGESDENIAKSVVEEADVICYVVTNDSIQETEFEFLKILKEHTKPVIILLNIQNNLRDRGRLEYFLRNPDKLFREDGKSGLNGHLTRIRRYAEEHYSNRYLPIIPVMLLAAQMSREPEYANQANKLLKASRLEAFLDSLRMSIIEHGPIRRSQTLLGSTACSLEKPRQWADAQACTYHRLAETIASKQTQLQHDFKRALSDVESELTQQIKSIFHDSHNSISRFATEHWEKSEQDLKTAWQKELRGSKLEQRLKTAIENSQKSLEERTLKILEELGNELELLAEFDIETSSFSQAAGNFFERNKDYLRLGAALLGAIGAGIGFLLGGGILAGAFGLVGTAIGVFTQRLKGKTKRRSDATQMISAELAQQLTKHEKKILKNIEGQLRKNSDSITDSLNSYFQRLGDGLEEISKCLSETEAALKANSDTLNLAYGERIIEWAIGHEQKVLDVKRICGKRIEIKSLGPHSPKKDLTELSEILQEDLILNY